MKKRLEREIKMIEEGSFHFQEDSESWMDEEDIRAYVTYLPDDREMEANGEVQRPVQITSATETRTAFRCLGDRSEVQVNMRALCVCSCGRVRPCVLACASVRLHARMPVFAACVCAACVCVYLRLYLCVHTCTHTRTLTSADTDGDRL